MVPLKMKMSQNIWSAFNLSISRSNKEEEDIKDIASKNGQHSNNNKSKDTEVNIPTKDQPDQNSSYSIINRKTLEISLAEIMGSFMLMFFGCMSLISGFNESPIPNMQAGMMFACIVATIITIFGHISGAFLNPAVTVSACILKQISIGDGIVYIISQCIGCILGYAALGVITPEDILNFGVSPERGICSTIPHESISDSQAFLAEYLSTSLLIYTCCGVWDHRNAHQGNLNAIKFAFVIALCSGTIGPYTGAGMNPARSLAPAFVNNIWTKHWIYWTAPLLAAVTTPLIYVNLFERQRFNKNCNEETPLNGISNQSFSGD